MASSNLDPSTGSDLLDPLVTTRLDLLDGLEKQWMSLALSLDSAVLKGLPNDSRDVLRKQYRTAEIDHGDQGLPCHEVPEKFMKSSNFLSKS